MKNFQEMCQFLLPFLLWLPHLLSIMMGRAQTGKIAAQNERQKEWVSGRTSGGGPSSPYMTQEKYSMVEMQEPN
jgi:hypothetical protein